MADVAPDVLVNAVLGKVNDVLLNGDGTVIPKSDDHFLAFLSPGIPMVPEDFDYANEGFGGVYRRRVDENAPEDSTGPAGPAEPDVASQLAADALRKYAQAESFYNIVDQVPDVAGIVDANRINAWHPESRISRIYAMALQHSQVFDNQPDAETLAKLDRWRSKLVTTRKERDVVTDEEVEVTEDSPLVVTYREKMTGWLTTALEYNDMRISALAGKDQDAVHRAALNGPLLQKKVEAAMADWSGTGHKGDFEALTAAIASVEDRAFVLLKQRYKQDFARSMITNPSSGSNFPYCAPASAAFARENSGWTRFYFNSGSWESNHAFRSSNSGGVGGFHVGLFGVAGGANVQGSTWQGSVDTSSFSLEFEMARVPIARPGVSIDYLLSRFWRFLPDDPTVSTALVSDGKRPPAGLLPGLTTDLVMVRNLKLKLGDRHSDFLRQRDNISGAGGVSFGPFHLGGAHAQSSATGASAARWTDQGIEVDGMQLIGFGCYLMPKSPDPHPSITAWI